MDLETETQAIGDHFCPNCGAEEDGFFCRNCGALLRGEDMVLCPRCHQIVPGDRFCNQCGQELVGIALSLKQLALAGDTFWVMEGTATPAADSEIESEIQIEDLEPVAGLEDGLEKGTIPDWLRELTTAPLPAEVEARVYPSLEPVEQAAAAKTTRFLAVAILLLGTLFLGLLVTAAVLLLHGGV